jgi:dienelactone hydrolase
MRTRRRLARILISVTISVTTLCFVGSVLVLLRDPLPHFVARRSTLAAAVEAPSWVENGFALTSVRLTATSGLTVDLLVRRAQADAGRRLPLALVLGGHRTGRDAARLVGNTRGAVVAALSYPYSGDGRPDALTFVRDIPRIRRAFLDTPPAIMLALDYLLARDDVDPRRVEAAGVSLGAPFVSIASALDNRVTRVWAIHGSGGSYRPLEQNMRQSISFAPLRFVAASIANVIIAGPRLDPVHWAPRIAPRPFIMVNADADERLPRATIEALYRSAREPKELIWMPGGHVHGDSATMHRLVEIVMERMLHDPRLSGGSAY